MNGQGKNPVRMREHFMFRYWKSKVSIFKEGPEPLPRCYQYEMHMQVARLFKHRKLDNCHKSTKRGLQRRDVEMAETCGEMEFSPEGGGGRGEG